MVYIPLGISQSPLALGAFCARVREISHNFSTLLSKMNKIPATHVVTNRFKNSFVPDHAIY